MAKRKLTRRQAWRVDKIQAERAKRAERRDSQLDAKLEGGDLGPEQSGLIISHFGRSVDVEALDGPAAGAIHRCHMRTHLGQLVTGDRVIWRASNDGGVVVAAQPRESELQRPNNMGELKPVAANIDFIVIVFAVEPRAHPNLIDRYLVAAESCGIEPVLLLNKVDLLDTEAGAYLPPLLAQYEAIGYRVLKASTTAEHGLDDLKDLLKDRVSVFVGQSGVGKSSLINSLLPGIDLKVGELSEQTRKGRHTTTTARLFHFPDGGELIDSPGIREFALWHIEPEQVLEGFRELRPLLGHCRFRDCKHESEPGCAFKAALESGEISESRFNSYRQILQSLQAGQIRES
ncbi:Ribosome small subunit-stimulated GTPase EngC [Marinobacterium lacunae]|uniref:Small ribosomal subunit biogenesis GTPase RsgA n=1 Tax=Marinobacterium lacunae TaxID=1232683 RepID=A0A081G238_9GAMM|nr:small ribosomal subunit biogenesis GTPase RsgA [Marinobacterium lacunae]KEA64843.1 Ribosome small subunit-stimulated GTPase EngC [Marinobacterium lacunae]MBR9883244.1 small ribosomal subunit biogenesis GTPase RsgA [Oceanospirillales bacterium]